MAANWESLVEEANPSIDPALRRRFLGAWREHREVFGYTLLAELPYALRNAIRDHGDELRGLDYQLLVVDEYQDLNACDLEVIRLIGRRGTAIVAVGDDDQSIYSFRKAAPEGIRRFPFDYGDASDYPLTIGLRSGGAILDWASSVIEGDPDRTPRPRLQAAEGLPSGEVALLAYADASAEAEGIASIVERLRADGVPAGEILILFRSDYRGSFSAPVKSALTRRGIPFADPEAVNIMLEDRPNRWQIEAIRVLVDRDDSLAWAGLLHLTLGVGADFVTYVYDRARAAGHKFGAALLEAHADGYPEAPRSARAAQRIVERILSWVDSVTVPDRTEVRWGEWINESCTDWPWDPPTDTFRTLLRDIDEVTEPGVTLGRYLGQITPLAKDLALARGDSVRIMTMAGAKGLTVDAAIVGAAEEGVVPRPSADRSEERRLLYVAMTRARGHLFLTWARRRFGPTARAGAPRVGALRQFSTFLETGPVESEDGRRYLDHRT
jgi:DNA helicase-2/ATP-dependent DNA helicase PcrA